MLGVGAFGLTGAVLGTELARMLRERIHEHLTLDESARRALRRGQRRLALGGATPPGRAAARPASR